MARRESTISLSSTRIGEGRRESVAQLPTAARRESVSVSQLSSLPPGMAERRRHHQSIFQPIVDEETSLPAGEKAVSPDTQSIQSKQDELSSAEKQATRKISLNIADTTQEEGEEKAEEQSDTFNLESISGAARSRTRTRKSSAISIGSSSGRGKRDTGRSVSPDDTASIASSGTRAVSSRRRSIFKRRDSTFSTASTISGINEQQGSVDENPLAPPPSAAMAASLLTGHQQSEFFNIKAKRAGSIVPTAALLFAVKQPLLTLAKNGEWAQLELALKMTPKNDERLTVTDPDTGETMLMLACRSNKLVVIERLLDLGVSVNAKANDKRTALHYAAQHCHDDVLKVLLAKKADPNLCGGILNQLPLHIVLSRPKGVGVAGLTLLRATARESRIQADGCGYLPISYAIQSGYFGIVRECLVFYRPEQFRWRHETTGDYLVHLAARKGNLKIMNYLGLECQANMNVQNGDGQTPLHIATSLGNEMMVRMLESCKAHANILDNNEQTPIHIAAEHGFTVIVEVLIERFRAKVHLRTKDGSTLMHRAAEKGFVDTVDAFIRRGVAINMPNKNAYHALHVAAEKGHAEVVKLLVRRGSPVDARTIEGYTPLHIAVINCHPEIIQTLLGYGAKVDITGGAAMEAPLHIAARLTEGGFACAEMLMKSGAHVNKGDGTNGETPLHIAARHGQLEILEMLLAEDGNPKFKSKFGETVLHVAVRGCHIKIVTLLIDFMTNKYSPEKATELINTSNNEGETAFHLAATLENYQAHYDGEEVDILKLLLEKGGEPLATTRVMAENALHYCATSGNPDICSEIVRHLGINFQTVCNRQNKIGRSPLMVASEQGNAKVAKVLLANNARADVFDEEGNAGLHLAAENGRTECCEILLKHKAFINAKSRVGYTPLHFAAKNGFGALVKKLLDKYHAAVNALALDKKTPLHLAAENGQNYVCQVLLEFKADADAIDEMGHTPLHLAAQNDFSNVVKMFIKRKPELVTAVSKNGMTCAHIAASKGAVSVVKELLLYSKNLVIGTAIIGSTNPNYNDSLPIHLAVSSGFSEVVRVLIEAGSSDTSENAEGMNAIHLAAKEGNVDILHSIPSRHHLARHSHKNGLSPIHVAAFYGDAEFVHEILVHVDANIKTLAPLNASAVSDPVLKNLISSDYGLTCLHFAAFNGHTAVVRQLFNVPGVETDVASTVLGRLPMHLACGNGHLPVVSILVSRTAGLLSVADSRGRMPLHLAAENGHIEMVSNLLSQGAEINASDSDGWTALHYATKGGYFHLIKLLIDGGASPALKTTEGKTALMLSAHGNHIDALTYLVEREHDTEELMEEDSFLMDLMLCGKANENKSIDEFVDHSPAPLYTAARLAKLYRELAFKERERAKDLNDAGRYLEHTATELLGIAASVAPPSSILRAVNTKAVPLLDMLLEDNMKEVIEHAVVQRYLSDIWAGSMSTWPAKRLALLFLGFMFCPPMWAYYCLPLASYHRYYHIPIIKFLALLVSHCYLIGIFIFIAAIPLDPIVYRKSFAPFWYEYLCLLWVSGMLVAELTNQGARTGLGTLRPCIVAFAAAASLCQTLAIGYDLSGNHMTALNLMYLRNFMLSLALFSNIILTLDFLLIHHLFGEFGIVIAAVFKDLVIFLVVVLIFVIAFSFQICCIYSPIKGAVILHEDRAMQSSNVNYTSNFTSMTVAELASEHLVSNNDSISDFGSGSGAYEVQYDNLVSGDPMTDAFSFTSLDNDQTLEMRSPRSARSADHLVGNQTNHSNETKNVGKHSAVKCRISTTGEEIHGPNATELEAAIQAQQDAINEDDEAPTMSNKDPNVLLAIFVTLYFSIFGMCSIDQFPIAEGVPLWHRFIIEVIFGVYMLVFAIILIPLLIAMLTETYIRIHQRSEAEWKFGRAKLIRSMVKISSTPPPLNLFVRPYIYINALKKHGMEMFTIYANFFIAEDEREGAKEAFEGRSTAGESRAKTTPRRTGAAKAALESLSWRLILTRLTNCINFFPEATRRKSVLSKLATPATVGQQAIKVVGDEGPQRIEDVLDWSIVIYRYRSDNSDSVLLSEATSSGNKQEDGAGEENGEDNEKQDGDNQPAITISAS